MSQEVTSLQRHYESVTGSVFVSLQILHFLNGVLIEQD